MHVDIEGVSYSIIKDWCFQLLFDIDSFVMLGLQIFLLI